MKTRPPSFTYLKKDGQVLGHDTQNLLLQNDFVKLLMQCLNLDYMVEIYVLETMTVITMIVLMVVI